MSHRIPPRTFREWTGSVVGWYGLLAPEIMEVLEASPSKPSVSSVVLMVVALPPGSWTRNVSLHGTNRGEPDGSTSRRLVIRHKTHFAPYGLEVDGVKKKTTRAHTRSTFTVAPRRNARASRAGKFRGYARVATPRRRRHDGRTSDCVRRVHSFASRRRSAMDGCG